MDKLLTSSEAAEYLGVDVKEFEHLVGKYKIPHYRIAGKFLRFSQQELEKYKHKIQKLTVKDKIQNVEYSHPPLKLKEKIFEFIRFNDFYILSFIIILLLLYYIFK